MKAINDLIGSETQRLLEVKLPLRSRLWRHAGVSSFAQRGFASMGERANARLHQATAIKTEPADGDAVEVQTRFCKADSGDFLSDCRGIGLGVVLGVFFWCGVGFGMWYVVN